MVLVSLICLMCQSSVRMKLDDELIEVAAIRASAVGKLAYLHLNFAASIAMDAFRSVMVNFDFVMMLILMLARAVPRVCISNL